MDWRVEQPEDLFPARRDAAMYLSGLGGFWGGIGGILIAAATGTSLAVLVIVVLLLASTVLIMNATRKLEGRITGRVVGPWPFGYASLRTQVIATLPSTVMAAAQRLDFNAVVVTLGMYSLLVLDFFAMAILWGRR